MFTRNRTTIALTLAAVAMVTLLLTTTSANAGFIATVQSDWGAEIGGSGYTHAVNFSNLNNSAPNIVNVNGVVFENSTGSFSGGNTTYSNLIGNNDTNNITNSNGLNLRFKHDGDTTASVTLDAGSLTAGNPYELKLFFVGWDSNPRETTITDDLTNDSITFDLDGAGNDEGLVVTYNYTAQASGGLNLSFVFTVNNSSAHFYALTNQVVPEPATLALAAVGLLGLRRRRRRA